MKNQKILMVGFGSIGPAVLPLILKHIEIEPTHIEIIANDDRNKSLAEELGVKFSHVTLTPHNYQKEISSRLKKGDVLLNLSVWVSSADLISLCQDLGVMYLDTSIEVWPGAGRARGFERRKVVLEKRHQKPHAATALLCHGANPGLISHFAKQAVLDVAQKVLAPKLFAELSETGDWGRLAQEAGIVTLHIAERDTQISSNGRRIHEYVNTWSVEGFLDEAEEHTGFSWGTHEAEIPSHLVKAKHSGKAQVIELNRSGGKVELKSWVPSAGAFHGFVIPHAEGFSLGELFFSNHT
ncbi:MAG: homospermidine synthase, partial [Gammaproteobacteria bacterium]|nr:homospermidine synthase [Gammaproteobacteria bacterium]